MQRIRTHLLPFLDQDSLDVDGVPTGITVGEVRALFEMAQEFRVQAGKWQDLYATMDPPLPASRTEAQYHSLVEGWEK